MVPFGQLHLWRSKLLSRPAVRFRSPRGGDRRTKSTRKCQAQARSGAGIVSAEGHRVVVRAVWQGWRNERFRPALAEVSCCLPILPAGRTRLCALRAEEKGAEFAGLARAAAYRKEAQTSAKSRRMA